MLKLPNTSTSDRVELIT